VRGNAKLLGKAVDGHPGVSPNLVTNCPNEEEEEPRDERQWTLKPGENQWLGPQNEQPRITFVNTYFTAGGVGENEKGDGPKRLETEDNV